jgi:L-fucose isomerase-like protein
VNCIKKSTFALFFGNRGFFPATLIASGRKEMIPELNGLGHYVLMTDVETTRYGAVETPQDGEVYANFLRASRGKFGGVIVCLPNFGDETGAVAALQEAGVPTMLKLDRTFEPDPKKQCLYNERFAKYQLLWPLMTDYLQGLAT